MALRKRARRRDKTSGEKLKDCCRGFVAFVFSNVGIIALFLGYAIIGAIVFNKIEGESEREKKDDVVELRRSTVNELWEITKQFNVMFEGNWTELVDEKILQFQNSIVKAVGEGYDGRAEVASQWTFSGGFLYSLTVMTTIGYGNIAPRTAMGKMVTIFYTCIGFPLFLLYLSNIGSVLAQSFKWLYAKLCKCRPARVEVVTLGPPGPPEAEAEDEEAPRWLPDELGSYRSQPPDPDAASSAGGGSSSGSSSSSSELDLSQVTVPISMCLIIMAVYICGGAMFFARLEENWDFLTSCYFCFISLSTIGFGDYVPGDSIRSETGSVETGFVLTSMYLMLGMAIIAMCFNLMQEEVIQKVRSCARCLGCLRDQG